MARIGLIGPGAVGGIMAGWLARSGEHDVVVCARRALATIEVETPQETFSVRPRVITNLADARPVDWVLVATKTYDAEGAASWLKPLASQGAPVAVLQNGVEHRGRFAPYLPPGQILPVVVQCAAERPEPTRFRQRGEGRLVVPEGRLGAEFAGLFARTGIKVELSADFTSELWRKLCLNVAGALNALLLEPNRAFNLEPVAELARELMRECIAVGRAEGAVLDDALVEQCLEGYRKAPPDGVNSLLADRLAGRPMESDARNGAVVRLGRKHGIATPYNRMAVALLDACRGLRVANPGS